MVTMVDEIFDRQYQTGRAELHAAIAGTLVRLVKSVGTAFDVLARIEYQAPWTAKTPARH